VEEKNKEDKNEEDMVPSFAETYEALEKVRTFFYVHSVTDADRERIFILEKSYFQLRQNSAMKQKTMYDFLRSKKWIFGFFVFAHFSFIFYAPFKNEKSRVHCTGLFEMVVSVLTTCHTHYTSHSSM
jgi:hypothetical protein